jgi:hypothetical protein
MGERDEAAQSLARADKAMSVAEQLLADEQVTYADVCRCMLTYADVC